MEQRTKWSLRNTWKHTQTALHTFLQSEMLFSLHFNRNILTETYLSTRFCRGEKNVFLVGHSVLAKSFKLSKMSSVFVFSKCMY